MTKRRDLNNLKQKDKYLAHKDCDCKECYALNLWLDQMIEALENDCE